ncbi:hypothetical protein GCM10022247_45990 [Allokutzneria multivorans]|uniref:Uncharacterized protein n=1 Tax=Allokutzneria multivorans TaxID=1142134 RepID=A0ABP7SWD4_9PSEU
MRDKGDCSEGDDLTNDRLLVGPLIEHAACEAERGANEEERAYLASSWSCCSRPLLRFSGWWAGCARCDKVKAVQPMRLWETEHHAETGDERAQDELSATGLEPLGDKQT